MRCARSGLLTKGRPWALLATAPACPPPAQDGLRVCRGSGHRRAAFRTSRAPRTEPLTKPGDASCRAMSARTRTAPRVGPRPDRQRFSYSQPPRAHDHPRALGGDGDTRIHPSGRPGLSGPFTGGLRRCSGTPRLHSPGVRRLTPRIEGTRMRPRDPSRADPTGPGIHGTSPQLNRRPEEPRGEIERGCQGALMQPLHTALEITSPRERLLRKFLRDVVRVTISRGELARIIGKVRQTLDRPYEALLEDLPAQAWLNVDETGPTQNGQRRWTWCFHARLYTLFKSDPTRSAEVVIEVLGTEFDGVLGGDYFAAYRRYHREFGVLLQFGLAHLMRDVKFLTTLPDARDRAYGERLREALRQGSAVIHRREELSAVTFGSQLEAARIAVLRCGTQDVPGTQHSRNLAKRLETPGESYCRFLTTPDVEPANNLAEQAIRFVVLDRLVTQGTRSEAGDRWCERIWTVIATCSQQGRSVFAYLEAAVGAWFDGTEAPSLLPEV